MDVICTTRIPEFFLITLMIPTGNISKKSSMRHELGQAVADFNINLPQSVDVCSLHVRISVGNSAGMSPPSETIKVGKP